MSDEIWKRNEVESPCVKLCVVHPETRLCTGCYRSIDEIGAWSRMTPEERRSIMNPPTRNSISRNAASPMTHEGTPTSSK